jgi:hypothetical protein
MLTGRVNHNGLISGFGGHDGGDQGADEQDAAEFYILEYLQQNHHLDQAAAQAVLSKMIDSGENIVEWALLLHSESIVAIDRLKLLLP